MMKLIFILISFLGIYCPTFAQPPAEENYDFWRPVLENKYPILVRNIHDADTMDVDIVVPEFNLLITKQTLRCSNFDACEISRIRKTVKISDAELEKGKQARDYVVQLFGKYIACISVSSKKDAYGRTLAKVYLTDADHPNLYLDLRDLIFLKGFDRSQLQDNK